MITRSLSLPWAAGLFEGDGHALVAIPLKKGSLVTGGYIAKRDYPCPEVCVTNTDISLLSKFREIVGVGSIFGPYKNLGWGEKPIFRYCVRGKNAELVARLLMPFCATSSKRRQLLTIADFQVQSYELSQAEGLAWTAGFFEAEGCAFSFFHKHGKHQKGYLNPKVVVVNTQLEPLERIKSIVGCGSVYLSSRQRGKNAAQYQFTAESESAQKFGRSILPFVVSTEKRRQLAKMGVEG